MSNTKLAVSSMAPRGRDPSDNRGAAFAAVRYTIAANRTAQSLTLKVVNDSATPAVPLACRTGSAWSPADAGTWSTAPKVDLVRVRCSQHAADLRALRATERAHLYGGVCREARPNDGGRRPNWSNILSNERRRTVTAAAALVRRGHSEP
jgi:hypothetical protein